MGFFMAVSAVLLLVLYGRALSAPFVYDDVGSIVQNQTLTPFSSAVRYFFTHATVLTANFRGTGAQTYRPLFWVSLALDNAVWDKDPFGFHLTELLLHWLNGLLLFSLSKRFVDFVIAVVATVLWLLLPINSEVVAWASARGHALCFFWLLSALCLALRYMEQKQLKTALAFFTCACLALLSNEAGVLLLPLLLVVLYFVREPNRFSSVHLAALSLTAGGLYGVIRLVVGTEPSSGHGNTWSVGLAFVQYFRWALLPLHMSIERSTSMPQGRSSIAALAAWTLLIALATIAFLVRKLNRPISAGLLWFIVATLPYCGFVFIYQGAAERYLYIASAGLTLAVASFVQLSRRSVRNGCVVLLVLWLGWSVWRLEARLSDWADPVRLFQSSLAATPNSPTLPLDLASVLLDRGIAAEDKLDYTVAEVNFREAMHYAPQEIAPLNNLGILLFKEGKRVEGMSYVQRAILLRPSDPNPYFNMGVLLHASGEDSRALDFYVKALKLKPNEPDVLAEVRKLHLH